MKKNLFQLINFKVLTFRYINVLFILLILNTWIVFSKRVNADDLSGGEYYYSYSQDFNDDLAWVEFAGNNSFYGCVNSVGKVLYYVNTNDTISIPSSFESGYSLIPTRDSVIIINSDGDITCRYDNLPEGYKYAFGDGYSCVAYSVSDFYGTSNSFVLKDPLGNILVSSDNYAPTFLSYEGSGIFKVEDISKAECTLFLCKKGGQVLGPFWTAGGIGGGYLVVSEDRYNQFVVDSEGSIKEIELDDSYEYEGSGYGHIIYGNSSGGTFGVYTAATDSFKVYDGIYKQYLDTFVMRISAWENGISMFTTGADGENYLACVDYDFNPIGDPIKLPYSATGGIIEGDHIFIPNGHESVLYVYDFNNNLTATIPVYNGTGNVSIKNGIVHQITLEVGIPYENLDGSPLFDEFDLSDCKFVDLYTSNSNSNTNYSEDSWEEDTLDEIIMENENELQPVETDFFESPVYYDNENSFFVCDPAIFYITIDDVYDYFDSYVIESPVDWNSWGIDNMQLVEVSDEYYTYALLFIRNHLVFCMFDIYDFEEEDPAYPYWAEIGAREYFEREPDREASRDIGIEYTWDEAEYSYSQFEEPHYDDSSRAFFRQIYTANNWQDFL